MEILHSPPSSSSFVPLAEHQSQTPESFYSGPPVLHHLSRRCKIVILERSLKGSPALSGLRAGEGGNGGAAATTETTTNGEAGDEDKEIIVEGVDVWITSEKLFLYATSARGVAIPYPSISLHAIQRLQLPGSPEGAELCQGLYMQLAGSSSPDEENDDEEDDSISLTIIPPPGEAVSTETAAAAGEPAEGAVERETTPEGEDKPSSPAQVLFAALSACSNLHPDPNLEDEDMDDDSNDQQLQGSSLFQAGLIQPGNNSGEGGLPPPVGGSSGWITAENMHEYFDEEGNWRGEGPGPNPMGPGAGIVRGRDDEDGPDEDETKWRRTS